MDPLEQIKQILVENEEKMNDEKEPVNGKAMQMKNVESSRMEKPSGMNQSPQVVLSGPGVDVIKDLISKIPAAKHPQNDPKAKNTSVNMVQTDLTTTNLGGKKASVYNKSNETEEADEAPESETETETENEEFEGGKGKLIKEKQPTREHLEALFNGESLSEDFKQKAAIIFETALAEREEYLRQEISAEYESLAEEYVTHIQNEINEQVDNYLGYVVNEWVEENRLQIENGIRLEIAESFIEGLRTLFVEHGVDVPDSDVNLVDELANRISELEENLNTEINRNIELNESIESYRRNELIATIGEDLTAAEFDRFMKLCENVAYESDDKFINNVNTIKESYFGENTNQTKTVSPVNYLTESVEENSNESSNDSGETPAIMEQYVQTLARFGKK